ncbi:hypothetical protein JHV666_46620 [Mycobacterium avium subsp. hominissuis]|nr:hypothetical protein MAH_2295 [Mycobacterium avium subsp. hominissuis TH135]
MWLDFILVIFHDAAALMVQIRWRGRMRPATPGTLGAARLNPLCHFGFCSHIAAILVGVPA